MEYKTLMYMVWKYFSSEDRSNSINSILPHALKKKLPSINYRARSCFNYTTQRNVSRIILTCFVQIYKFYGGKIKVLLSGLEKVRRLLNSSFTVSLIF